MVAAMIGFFFILIVMVFVIIRRQLEKNKLSTTMFDHSAMRLQLQLEEAADVIIERMENHVNHLEYLIEEADARIFELDTRIKMIEELSKQQNKVEKNIAVDTNEVVSPMVNENLIEENNENRIEEIKVMQPKFVLKDTALNAAVFDMLTKGCSLDQIAKETGIGKGAIKLIKQMYKNKNLNEI